MKIKKSSVPGTASVADVGGIRISAEEFLNSYEYGPAFVKREKDSQRRYLEFMIYEKLLAKEGYSKGLDTTGELKEMLADIKGDLASEQMYREDIWNKIRIGKAAIESGIKKSLITYNIRWIYKKSLEEISDDFAGIKNGLPFDSLFNAQLNESITYDLRSVETNAFKLARNNPALKSIIDSLKAGEISNPVKTPDGFYIVRLDNIWKNMAVTETEYEKLKYDVRTTLFRDKADSLSDIYVQKLMKRESPVIERLTFNMLKAVLGKKLLVPTQYAEWDMLKNIHPFEPGFNPDEAARWMDRNLVQLKSGTVTLGDFFRWYRTREPYIKLNETSHQAFFQSLEQTVWRMVRDRLLTAEAEKRKFDRSENVKRQVKWWEDKLVFSKMKLEIAAGIKVDSISVKDYYEKNIRQYVDDKGAKKPFEEVKNDARNDLYAFEYTKKLINRVLGLKERTKITINSKILNALPADIKDDSGAIDVYSVKNGGTFMHQAFPVIDYEWQYMN
ncbi:MAG: peptidyl-prolyl cis-trans isomerase [Syntrophothermus sp.]